MEGATVPVGIWRITERCERRWIGMKATSTIQEREYRDRAQWEEGRSNVYLMNTGLPCVPNRHYLKTIKKATMTLD